MSHKPITERGKESKEEEMDATIRPEGHQCPPKKSHKPKTEHASLIFLVEPHQQGQPKQM